jgi:mannose/fructose/sorbose-specific phosphotransferase system IIA component
MVGIVVAGHAGLPAGLLDAVRVIGGEQEQLAVVALDESEGPEMLEARIATAIQQVDTGSGVLVLVDLFGGTPFNASARLAVARRDIEVVAGFNLGMVLEVILQRSGLELTELAALARRAGAEAIRSLFDTLQGVPAPRGTEESRG